MSRPLIDYVIEAKAQFLLDIDAELSKPELAEIHDCLRAEQHRVVEGELEQLTTECVDYWCLV